jgi:hypothetical protein
VILLDWSGVEPTGVERSERSIGAGFDWLQDGVEPRFWSVLELR